jgi:hypothetical protein
MYQGRNKLRIGTSGYRRRLISCLPIDDVVVRSAENQKNMGTYARLALYWVPDIIDAAAAYSKDYRDTEESSEIFDGYVLHA